LEWFGFVRRFIWADAGFSILRPIRRLIEDTEPRFDPTVFPLEGTGEQVPGNQKSDAENDAARVPPAPLGSSKRYSTADYRALYLSGELTPLAVVQSILPLIRRDTQPPGEHSVAWFDVKVDAVIKAAEASTLRYKEKRSLGPLDGVPTAVKDEYDIEGYRTSLGSVNDYTGKVVNEDGTIDPWCVKMLADAGAVILGKLSMHEFGMGKWCLLLITLASLTKTKTHPETTSLMEHRATHITPSTIQEAVPQDRHTPFLSVFCPSRLAVMAAVASDCPHRSTPSLVSSQLMGVSLARRDKTTATRTASMAPLQPTCAR
jgi:hypothetical protein